MKFERKGEGIPEYEANMTPFIDVIFQLVLFFVFSLKFLAFEGQINAFLPKNRGLDAAAQDFSKELKQVTLFLEWSESTEGGTVQLRVLQYFPEGGGEPLDDYLFPMDPGVRRVMGSTGPQLETETKMITPDGKKGGKVVYNYAAPYFDPLEQYLRRMKADYEARSGLGSGLRLTVNFESAVPWQMVVNIVDICTRVGISDFALNPLELEY
jgi:biopolymer transport protein ExbD